MAKVWTVDMDDRLRELHGTMPLGDVASILGVTKPAVRARVTRLSIAKKPSWSDAEISAIIDLYREAGKDGYLGLQEFAASIGKSASGVSEKAASLGLQMGPSRKKVAKRKPTKKYDTVDELRAAQSEAAKRRLLENGHPRGMLGKKHPASALLAISEASKASWLGKSPEQREEHINKSVLALREKGWRPPEVKRGTWDAGWREIGGKRKFYRSRWEANYARYLQWLKDLGEIADWQHEPETFWFEAIRRGVRSYKPDFRVWETSGASCLHEVKGWMDDRSRTCLARMAKYYPAEKIILIDGRAYRSIRIKVMRLIEGWEDHQRDTHA